MYCDKFSFKRDFNKSLKTKQMMLITQGNTLDGWTVLSGCYCFVTLTFNFKVTGGLLKVRFWPFFHILAQFSYTER